MRPTRLVFSLPSSPESVLLRLSNPRLQRRGVHVQFWYTFWYGFCATGIPKIHECEWFSAHGIASSSRWRSEQRVVQLSHRLAMNLCSSGKASFAKVVAVLARFVLKKITTGGHLRSVLHIELAHHRIRSQAARLVGPFRNCSVGSVINFQGELARCLEVLGPEPDRRRGGPAHKSRPRRAALLLRTSRLFCF